MSGCDNTGTPVAVKKLMVMQFTDAEVYNFKREASIMEYASNPPPSPLPPLTRTHARVVSCRVCRACHVCRVGSCAGSTATTRAS